VIRLRLVTHRQALDAITLLFQPLEGKLAFREPKGTCDPPSIDVQPEKAWVVCVLPK
jgi:hypothetical protein